MIEKTKRRVLLKLSGEALAPEDRAEGILDFTFVDKVAQIIKRCLAEGVEIAVIVGAGNIWRGARGVQVDRNRSDHMGMLGTVINSLALQDAFERNGIQTDVLTSVPMKAFAEPYTDRAAVAALEAGKVVIFGGGLGSPYFSTDTAAVLRAAEIKADTVLMAKNIDYVYSADPRKNADAKPIYEITYKEILDKGLRAFDMTAVQFCDENNIDALAFGLKNPENIYRAIIGDKVGTYMHK